jgi:tetraacyldisaccharide 4'-kinase
MLISRWLSSFFTRIWYTRDWMRYLFKPLSVLYGFIIRIRRRRYKSGRYAVKHYSVPVIVVGNITVGGSGKTPMVIWLVDFLKKTGHRPAIVARGYRGKARSWPQQVRPDSDPVVVGDEAVLLARRCHCPVAVGPDRSACVEAVLQHTDANVIIADDGLQHYALGRDIEIAVIDGERRFGNGELLPAGPLREPIERLKEVDFVIVNGVGKRGEYAMDLHARRACKLRDDDDCKSLTDFKAVVVHAIAGIGNPDRFFIDLRNQGLNITDHAYPDHYAYMAKDIEFGDTNPVLMTEKDAVKCRRYADDRHWYVPVEAELDKQFGPRLLAILEKRKKHG